MSTKRTGYRRPAARKAVEPGPALRRRPTRPQAADPHPGKLGLLLVRPNQDLVAHLVIDEAQLVEAASTRKGAEALAWAIVHDLVANTPSLRK